MKNIKALKKDLEIASEKKGKGTQQYCGFGSEA